MKAKVYVVVKTSGVGEIISLDLYSSHYDAQEAVRAEYEADMIEAEKNGKSVSGCGLAIDYAWLELDQDENYGWDIFERDIPQEML
jgi:hypothetical protein